MKDTVEESWIVRIESAMISASDLIRISEAGMIAEDGSAVWIKLQGDAGCSESLSATLPGQRWRLRDGLLHPPNKRVPTGFLPDLQWRSIREAVDLQVPRPGVAARLPPDQRRNIRLVRGGSERPCSALLTSPENLLAWVEVVPDARLKGLTWISEHHAAEGSEETSFATGRCLVLGERLPPVAGTLMVAEQQVLIPAGFRWDPPIFAAQLRHLTGTRNNQWLLWESAENYSHLCEEDFVPLSRASVRSHRNQTH